MAKLDKAQQQYALTRITNMANTAATKVKYKADKFDQVKLAEQLTKKGFTVHNNYNLNGYISVTPTTAQLAAEDKAKISAKKKSDEIYAAAEEAKDQVMLGDSAEVTSILAALAKKFGI